MKISEINKAMIELDKIIWELKKRNGRKYMNYKKDSLAEEHIMEEITARTLPKEYLNLWEIMVK